MNNIRASGSHSFNYHVHQTSIIIIQAHGKILKHVQLIKFAGELCLSIRVMDQSIWSIFLSSFPLSHWNWLHSD